jgi:hypothetical protein
VAIEVFINTYAVPSKQNQRKRHDEMQERQEQLIDEFVERWTLRISPPILSVDFEDEARDLGRQLQSNGAPPPPSAPQSSPMVALWSEEPPRSNNHGRLRQVVIALP